MKLQCCLHPLGVCLRADAKQVGGCLRKQMYTCAFTPGGLTSMKHWPDLGLIGLELIGKGPGRNTGPIFEYS